MNVFKKYLPPSVKKIAKHFLDGECEKKELKYCPVCDKETIIKPFPYQAYFEKFYENGFIHSPFLFETLNLKNYRCNNCKASDRERLLALFLKNYLIGKSEIKLVDFAPVKPLKEFIKRHKNVIYRSADLYNEHVDDKVDITNMPIYNDETFDVFICSHILEHIENDLDAMKELYRITKKNGIGLCLVPILLNLDNSLENKEYLESEHLRWKYFGQNDHVRMYSKGDFVSRLEGVGFKVMQHGIDYFGSEIFDKIALDHKSVLYVVEK